MSQSIPSRAASLSSERITIRFNAARNKGEGEDVELPLKMVVIGNFQGTAGQVTVNNTPLNERKPVNIDKTRFSAVMQDIAPRLKTTVASHLPAALKTVPKDDSTNNKQQPEFGSELDLDLCFHSMDEFHPDNIIRQVPSLDRLFKLRELLIDLKRFPDRSQQILDQITDLAMG